MNTVDPAVPYGNPKTEAPNTKGAFNLLKSAGAAITEDTVYDSGAGRQMPRIRIDAGRIMHAVLPHEVFSLEQALDDAAYNVLCELIRRG